jgi:hypothetical protein
VARRVSVVAAQPATAPGPRRQCRERRPLSSAAPAAGGSLGAGARWSQVLVRREPVSDHHGHVREAEVCIEDISPWSPAVTARLRRTMRCQLPLWNVDHLAADIDQLQAGDVIAAVGPDARIRAVLDAAERGAGVELLRQFAAAELEGPVGTLLARHFDVVEHVAGPGEHGADFVCTSSSQLGSCQVVAVQVKAWQGVAYDTEVFGQLRRAKSRWPRMTAGLVLTTAERATDAFQLAAASLAADIDAEIRLLCRRELVRLLLETYLDPRARTGALEREGET